MQSKYNLTDSKTAINLAHAFALEGQAQAKYSFFAKIARREDYPALEKIFLSVREDEFGHAEMFYDFLSEGMPKTVLTPQVFVRTGLGDTPQNMRHTIELERSVWTTLYPEFGKTAEQEGFRTIAESFFAIADVEKRHDLQFSHLLERLSNNMLFSLPEQTTWICSNCGYHHVGKSAPAVCPGCLHKRFFFMTSFDLQYPYENTR